MTSASLHMKGACQSATHLAQGEEGAVDGGGFLEHLARGVRVLDALTASQVHKAHLDTAQMVYSSRRAVPHGQ